MERRLKEVLGAKITELTVFRDQITLSVEPADLQEVMTILRDDTSLSLSILMDLTAVDGRSQDKGLLTVYHLMDPETGRMLRVKASLAADDPRCPSVAGVWGNADWLEREAYDMFGIVFEGHPDLRRILMPDDWEGHPLLKDYPMEGGS